MSFLLATLRNVLLFLCFHKISFSISVLKNCHKQYFVKKRQFTCTWYFTTSAGLTLKPFNMLRLQSLYEEITISENLKCQDGNRKSTTLSTRSMSSQLKKERKEKNLVTEIFLSHFFVVYTKLHDIVLNIVNQSRWWNS